jgi:ABC-type multidrug transport system permease subunit
MSFGLFYGIIGLLVFLYSFAKQLQGINTYQQAIYNKSAYPIGDVIEAILIAFFCGAFWPVLLVVVCFVSVAG